MTQVRPPNGLVTGAPPERMVDPTEHFRPGSPARSPNGIAGTARHDLVDAAPPARRSTVSLIILVDGNSTDSTLITASSCRSDIKVVPQEGTGKGSALRTGFLAATGDIIVMMDADGSMAPQEIRHYLYFLNNGFDFVKGSRFIVGGGSLDITPFRRLGNRFLLTVFNTLYDAELTDLCYGFCAFHRRYLELLSLSASGFEIEAEMVVHAMQGGLRVVEVPSLELPRRSGKSNLHAVRDGIRVLRTVLRGHDSGMSGYVAQALSRGGAPELAKE